MNFYLSKCSQVGHASQGGSVQPDQSAVQQTGSDCRARPDPGGCLPPERVQLQEQSLLDDRRKNAQRNSRIFGRVWNVVICAINKTKQNKTKRNKS